MTPRPITGLLVSACLAGAASPSTAATLFDPALRFRVLTTEHFAIHFHQGALPLAMRLAPIAEDTWRALAKPLGVTPPPLTRVILADQTELANGYATPLPRDTIVIFTAWPAGAETIGDTDDWLRVAFTHEFTHIVHLDRSEGWARVVRNVFGRTLIAFPNELLPTWQIEGLAVYEESVMTGGGRLHAGDFRAIVDESARARSLEPLDRVNGGLTDWPGGAAAYAYGLGFHRYLADRFGSDSLARLADATARQLPYFGSRAFKKVYDESLGDLWREYEASEVAAASTATDDDRAVRRTHDGFQVVGPRFDRFVCSSCPPEIVYVAATPHDFPSMNRVALGGGPPRHVTRRFLGSTTAIGRETIYFDQLEDRRNVGLYGDLYALDRATGRVRPITFEARVTQPDLSLDEQSIVAVQDRVGARALVVVSTAALKGRATPESIDTLVFEPETQFNAPRWSPNGRSIAAERHRIGGRSEIVVVDVVSRIVRVVASMPGTRIATPAWTPDGRFIVAAVAPEDQPFNLFEFDAVTRAARQLTHTTGGATWPDVSPDGKTIAFVGYTVDGLDVFTVPYPPGSASAIAPITAGSPRPSARADADRAEQARRAEQAPPLHTEGYSPLPTLKPTSWTPIVTSDSSQLRVGAGTSGYDVLGYHFYAASATWLASGPEGAALLNRAQPDWSIVYAYDRWQPTFFAAASSATSFFAGPPTDSGTATSGNLRERKIEAGVVLPMHHTRVTHTALASLVRAADEYMLPDRTVAVDRTDARLAWSTVTAHRYGYSISADDGVAIGATADFGRATGASSVDGSIITVDATTITIDARAYLHGLSQHHVVALRGGIGSSSGDAAAGRTFLLGGPGPNPSIASFGSDTLSLLRGFPADTFAGSHIAIVNADYRFPIARPQRGVGTWPLFVHTLHGAIFVDAGHAWTAEFHASAMKTSVGAELSTDIIAGYYFPFALTVGIAHGHDFGGSVSGGPTVFFRVGRAF